MAEAYKCDICGKFYEVQHNDVPLADTIIQVDIWYKGKIVLTDYKKSLDLCNDCLKSFEKWLSNN